MNKYILLALVAVSQICSVPVWSQDDKKTMGHEELVSWKKINQKSISPDGRWVAWEVGAEEGDGYLELHAPATDETHRYERASRVRFTRDNDFAVFIVEPHQDSIRDLKRKKTKKEDLPHDTLYVVRLRDMDITRIPEVASFEVPGVDCGWFYYQMAERQLPRDTTETPAEEEVAEEEEKVKPRKESKDNGTELRILFPADGRTISLPFVTNAALAEEAPVLWLYSTGDGDAQTAGYYSFAGDSMRVEYPWSYACQHIHIRKDGGRALAIARTDSSKSNHPSVRLIEGQPGTEAWQMLSDSLLDTPSGLRINPHESPVYHEALDGYFLSVFDPPQERDTMLLDEEVAQVEVWHWQDARLHTQQKVQKDKRDKKGHYLYRSIDGQISTMLTNEDYPDLTHSRERSADWVLISNEEPFYKAVSWDGFPPARHVALKHIITGQVQSVADALVAQPSFSPGGDYLFYYMRADSSWYTYHIDGQTTHRHRSDDFIPYNEKFDMPDHPYPYGYVGWSDGDKDFYVYDKNDIWRLDPSGQQKPTRLTKGREDNRVFRYVKTDRKEQHLPDKDWLLHIFDEESKGSGWASWTPGSAPSTLLFSDDHYFATNILKADSAEAFIFTRENFIEFPDLRYSDNLFRTQKPLTRINPQQSDYKWGTVRQHKWTSADGIPLDGLLYLPDNFDPDRQYPMIVNFYEKSSDGLHRYRQPSPGRSTICYPFYTSRDYVLFIPDIVYRDGYPGESCFNSVMPGVHSLIDQGFIDKDRIGLQGHSWGGYQIAYLLTRTGLFRCAESGAPVVNMSSAYGGIRWETGLSRMFQYERTQSRIGGTLWAYPMRYIENSPLFTMDKVTTPVLIMHNDKDGHVPWYQGIEYFVALRRLGKPAWLLNYNDEPHWPLRLENRKDFNIRMQQFFDHYLQDAPMPLWMQRGVPATEKGILQGLEYSEE